MKFLRSGPGVHRLFLAAAGSLTVTLFFPFNASPNPPERLYLMGQLSLAAGGLLFAVVRERQEGLSWRGLARSIPVNIVIWASGAAAVQAFYDGLPLAPALFFLGFPFTVFARLRYWSWVPASFLAVAAAGRYLFLGDREPAVWAALFLLYSLVLGNRLFVGEKRIKHLESMVKRINSDAREMMERIQDTDISENYDRIRGEEAAKAIALDEDGFLHKLLAWGCRVFNARTGILLVPDEPGYYRIRAAVHRGVEIRDGLVPADRGFIHITREREGVLCVSDATSAGRSLSFYPEETEVGSFLVKIVKDPKWGRDAGDGAALEKVRCVLYFDSEKIHAMSLDDVTARRLEEFGSLVLKAMDTAGYLQKRITEASRKDAISRYARDLTQSLDEEFIVHRALKAVVDAIPKCDGAAVMLYEDRGLSVRAAWGDLEHGLGSERILRGETSYMGWLLRRFAELESTQNIGDARGAEMVINNVQAKKHPFFRKGEKLGNVVSFAAIPCYLSQSGEPLKGAIAVISNEADTFRKEELEELRTFSGMMAPALDNAIQHRRVEDLSRTDGLTGLLNHRTFQIVLDGKLSHLSRGNFRSVAVIMVDGDRFKDVNDTYGHPVGDEVLVEMARRLKSGVRKNDAVARYGGEEFAVILDNAGEKEARNIAEKMRHSLRSRPFVTSAGKIQVTASLGFSVLAGTDSADKKELMERADQALYHAKKGGRDRVVSYRDIDAPTGMEGSVPEADTAIQEGKRW